MEQGIIHPSKSSQASPIHLVLKGDLDWKLFGFKWLKSVMTPDHYPLPFISNFTTSLQGATFFFKIDLVKACYQISIAEDDVCKTVTITPFDLFEFTKMPFRLKYGANVSAIY